jgi:uncharacterized protein YbjT (DUF2867 family)
MRARTTAAGFSSLVPPVMSRLCRALEERGERVRCLARRPDFLLPRVAATTEVAQGDVLDRARLDRALTKVDTAYYLVHSMGSAGSFEEQDRRGAVNFGEAARARRASPRLPGRARQLQDAALVPSAQPSEGGRQLMADSFDARAGKAS